MSEIRDWLIADDRRPGARCWWREGRHGYTDLLNAGLYCEAEAKSIERSSDRTRGDRKDKAVHISEVADELRMIRDKAQRLLDALDGSSATISAAHLCASNDGETDGRRNQAAGER